MKNHLKLFLIFARIGLFAFGGGYVMLPLLKREFSEKRDWVTEDEILDYFAISQCTPGVIAVNSATFIGRKRGGVLGALSATLGVVFPSIVIITIIATFLKNFAELTLVSYALKGIRASVCAIIANMVFELSKKTIKDKFSLIISVSVFLLMCFFDISPVIFIVLASTLGILLNLKKRGEEK